MTADRDLDRVVRSWLREDGREDADRVLDLVLDQLETTPQRRAGWLAQRLLNMNTTVRLVAAAAAVMVAALISYQFLVVPNFGGPPPVSPEPSASPEPSPAVAEFIIERPYVVYAEVHVPIREGWKQSHNFVTFGDRDRVGFSAWSTDGVYADPCQWQANLIELTDPVLPDDAGRVEQVVQLLIEQPNREPSVPSEVRIDDWGATMVELSVPEDLDLANCDLRRYNAWTDVSDPTGGNWNHQPGQSDIVYVVDMDRDPVILHAWLRAGATAEDRAELEAMLNSLRVGFPEDFAPSTN